MLMVMSVSKTLILGQGQIFFDIIIMNITKQIKRKLKLQSSCFTSGSNPSAYRRKKSKRLQQWSDIHDGLLRVNTELYAPLWTCLHCPGMMSDSAKEKIVRCLDCGPYACYCITHYLERHQDSPFHLPEVWNVSIE